MLTGLVIISSAQMLTYPAKLEVIILAGVFIVSICIQNLSMQVSILKGSGDSVYLHRLVLDYVDRQCD